MAFVRVRWGGTRPAAAGGLRGGAPAAFWWALLCLGAPWLRVLTPWGPVYPGQWMLVPLAAWALWRGPLARPDGRLEAPPLLPLALFAAFVGALALLRGQWSVLLAWAPACAALAVWAYAAYRLGLSGAPLATFVPAAVLFLGASLIAGGLAWLAQARWPGLCAAFDCDSAAPIPFPFRGGWISSAQYLLALVFLLPPVGGAFLDSWRDGTGGAQRWVLTAIVAAAGLGLLAGMRWWGFIVLALGLLLAAQALAPDRRPGDGLLLRGLAFFSVFAPVAFYGLVPGYGTSLLFQPGSARALGVRQSLPNPAVLSSEREVPVPVQVVNAGAVVLSASPHRPLRLRAVVLFTPRSGGESRMVDAGETRLVAGLAPGEEASLTVAVQVPPWVRQGYVSWSAEDEDGRPIGLAEGLQRGFRFVNADYASLADGGDDTLAALAARARAAAAPGMALPTPGSRRSLVEPVLGDAFDSLFFSPLWGHAGTARLPGQVFNPARSFLLQVLHQYGLTGLGLLAWFFADALRRSAQLGFGRHGGAKLTWRLVPVAWVLFAAMALLSGEPARFHSWWGCVLLGGFVQGVHERTFPGRAPRGPPRWLEGPLRGSGRAARGIGRAARLLLRTARGIGRAGAWLLRAGLAVGFGLVRGVGALLRGRNPGRGTFRRTASRTPFRGFRR